MRKEFLLGMADLKQGRLESTKQRLLAMGWYGDKAKENRSIFGVELGRLSQLFQAELLLAEGKTGEAISTMATPSLRAPVLGNLAILLHNLPFEQDVLARAYQKSGHLDRAIEEYLKLIQFDPKSQDRRLRNPFYHYRLARLYEQKGMKAEAKREYSAFLGIWKDADRQIPEFADAMKRFSQLQP